MKSTDNTKTLIGLYGDIHQTFCKATNHDVLVNMLDAFHDQVIRFSDFSDASGRYWKDLGNEFEEFVIALKQTIQSYLVKFWKNIWSVLLIKSVVS